MNRLEESRLIWDSGFDGDEFETRIQRIRQGMDRRNLNALILYTFPREFPSTSGYVRYVSNWSGDRERSPSLIILPDKGHPELIINSENYLPVAKEASWIKDIRVKKSGFANEAKDALNILGIKSGTLGVVGFDEMSTDDYVIFKKALTGYRVLKAEDVLDEVRLIKSPNEIHLIKKAAEICDKAFQGFEEVAKPGVREYEAIASMEYIAAHRGAERGGCSIASGPYTGQQPTTPRAKSFKKGEVVIISSVFRYRGYWAQVIRTGSIGESSGRGKDFLSLVSKAERDGIKALKPGNTMMKVYESVTSVMNGVYEKEKHLHVRLGHGMGLDYAEKPAFAFHTVLPDYDIEVQPGIVIELHPSILLSDLAVGAVLGDLCLVTESGVELLTKSDREFFNTQV